ncbi:GNAT family N-acetyltransferase [Alysiella crassa]|uniref:Ribosomal-protein-alanine acetyltransferase n=1 Tax=Alysiella crassa TaxID=153491 RepID=A0A376BNE3_9NEIS|nr:GNAT family N-acetyltransferase [Alysiella crassa]UOP06703.1 GNAT family N-acetyltransferase [Alysiella crassa]SSY71190.1 ribosomal-protein-alanine acetyltransferase [Alysiella crassa]
MFIRKLHSTDKTQWLVLWQEYLHFYQTSLPEHITEHTWQKLLSHEKMNAWGIFDDMGSLKGFAHTVEHPNTWNVGECLYLEDLFIAHDVRRQGLAEYLIKHIYEYANTQNCNRVYWVTAEDNLPAKALYQKLAQQSQMIQFRHDLNHQ